MADRLEKGWFGRLVRGVLEDLRRGFRPLIAYYLLFALLTAAVFTPLFSWAVSLLVSSRGRLSVNNEEILSFLASLRGLLFLVAAGVLAVVILFIEHAGMMLIGWFGHSGKRMSALGALLYIFRKLPGLGCLGFYKITVHLLLLLPFVAMGAAVYLLLLSSYDIYYLVTVKPPVWWIAVAIATVLILCAVAVNGYLYLRWILSLPALLIEGLSGRAALQRSSRLTQALRGRIGAVLLGFALTLAALPAALTFLFDVLGRLVFSWLPATRGVILPMVLLLMALYLMAVFTAGFLMIAMNSLAVTRIYAGLRRRSEGPEIPLEHAGEAPAALPGTARWTWASFSLALIIALAAAGMILRSFDLEDRVEITAHRGSSLFAPENSLSAIKRAIEDGAHYAEIDVQETSDGKVVLLHDKDLLRVAGLKKNIWEAAYDEIKDLDAGSWFSPDFKGERIPLLREAIALAGHRIKLNIELKYNGRDKRMAERVVEVLHEENFAGRCVVTSLNLDGLRRVREIDPAIRIGYILFESIGGVAGLDVDFLSVSARIAKTGLIEQAHRLGREVHVWTVNEPDKMERFIDLGADNLITDQPALASALLEERASMGDEELLLRKVRSWFLR